MALDDALTRPHDEPSATAPTMAPLTVGERLRPLALGMATIALAIGVGVGWLLHPAPTTRPAADSRWALALPDGFSLSTSDVPQLALSRDGRLQVAVVVGKSATPQLLLRRSDEFEPQLVSGTEGAGSPFFSPAGTGIGFFREDALLKIPVGGGPPIRLATVANSNRGATWSTDGYVYFSGDYVGPLSRVPESGCEVESVTHLYAARSERTHRWPEALPGGEAVLFTSDTQASTEYYDDARIEAVRPRDGERRVLVAEGPATSPNAFAPDGRTFLYDETESGSGSGDIWAMPVDGERRARTLTSGPFRKYSGQLSPDSRWLAYVSNESGQNSVYVRPFPTGEGRWQISFPQGDEPIWSRDGRELFYRAASVLFRVAVDATHGLTAGRPQPFLDRVASGGQVYSYRSLRTGGS